MFFCNHMPKVLIFFKCHGLQNCQSNHLLTNNYHPTLHKVLKNWQQLVDIRLHFPTFNFMNCKEMR